jgi:DGQHR domain-containing protein
MKIKIEVIKGKALGINVYRGFAKLSDLALISRADIYDSKENPTGTQRDLSPKHAREAYYYVKNNEVGYWPEVFLSTRVKDCFTYSEYEVSGKKFGYLEIDVTKIASSNKVQISRVDGNHRLHFADGKTKDYPALEKEVSFCLAYDLKLEEEISLFRDINNNQKRMNTSHLDNIEVRLSKEDEIKRKDPALYIAKQFSTDPQSPLLGRIFEGGKNLGPNMIPLRSLKSGIQYMLSRPTKLTALKDPDAEYRVIKNYFEALKLWQPEAWKNPADYILLRGAGLWGVCFIGANVIDKGLSIGKFDTDNLLKILKSGKNWDWSKKGNFEGLSGRGGAVKISDMVTAELIDENNISVSELYKQIMKD